MDAKKKYKKGLNECIKNGGVINVRVGLTKLTKSIKTTIVLSYLLDEFIKLDSLKINVPDENIMIMTTLTSSELRAVKKKIKNYSFMKVTREGIPASTFYEIDLDLYEAEMNKLDIQ